MRSVELTGGARAIKFEIERSCEKKRKFEEMPEVSDAKFSNTDHKTTQKFFTTRVAVPRCQPR